MVLAQLTPTAAKIYVTLNTLCAPTDNPRIARAPVTLLSQLANLAPRTCAYALRQLSQEPQLITCLPRLQRLRLFLSHRPLPLRPPHHPNLCTPMQHPRPKSPPSCTNMHTPPPHPCTHMQPPPHPPCITMQPHRKTTPHPQRKFHNLHRGAVTQSKSPHASRKTTPTSPVPLMSHPLPRRKIRRHATPPPTPPPTCTTGERFRDP